MTENRHSSILSVMERDRQKFLDMIRRVGTQNNSTTRADAVDAAKNLGKIESTAFLAYTHGVLTNKEYKDVDEAISAAIVTLKAS